jgi:hypothetical protein
LNPQPADYKSAALPLSYTSRDIPAKIAKLSEKTDHSVLKAEQDS